MYIFDAVYSNLVTSMAQELFPCFMVNMWVLSYNCIFKHVFVFKLKGKKLLALVGGEGHNKTSENATSTS